jgi:hypothetical protein
MWGLADAPAKAFYPNLLAAHVSNERTTQLIEAVMPLIETFRLQQPRDELIGRYFTVIW